MYPPSNNNCNYNNPIFSSLLHNMPSPCIQYEHEIFFEHYHDYYLQEQQIPFSEYTSIDILDESSETAKSQLNCTDSVKVLCDKEIVTINHGPSENEGEEGRENKGGEMSSTTSNRQQISRNKTNRSSNKDRHSKINTAQGPRDRRMRLSLDAARKFFNLQDMLQFDKPSKTIEWLLIKSEYAIKELTKGIGAALDPKESFTNTGNIGAISTNASSNISECESKVVDNLTIASDEFSSNHKMPKESFSIKEKKKGKTSRSRCPFHTITRESRNLARANARERTKRKKSLEDLCAQVQHSNMVNHSLYEVEELTSHQDNQLLGTKEINRADENNWVVNGNWNSFGIFNFQQNAGIFHENQFTDLQFCGKL